MKPPRLLSLKLKSESLSSLWALLLAPLPIAALLLILACSQHERIPAWDDGIPDETDISLFRAAAEVQRQYLALQDQWRGQLEVAKARNVGDSGQVPPQPKIAFLFLTRGPMPLAPVWDKFLKVRPCHVWVQARRKQVYNWDQVELSSRWCPVLQTGSSTPVHLAAPVFLVGMMVSGCFAVLILLRILI